MVLCGIYGILRKIVLLTYTVQFLENARKSKLFLVGKILPLYSFTEVNKRHIFGGDQIFTHFRGRVKRHPALPGRGVGGPSSFFQRPAEHTAMCNVFLLSTDAI